MWMQFIILFTLYHMTFLENLTNTSGEQLLSQVVRPHFWFIVYADPYTCNSTSSPLHQAIEYEMVFLNPDSQGDANIHFGDDMRGK